MKIEPNVDVFFGAGQKKSLSESYAIGLMPDNITILTTGRCS